MLIKRIENIGFKCIYKDPVIASSVSNWVEQSIAFEFCDHSVKRFSLPAEIELSSFNMQFGIQFSSKNNCFFLQSWEKGVYCFDLDDGSLLWLHKRKRACDIALIKENLFVYFLGFGIVRIDISTGESIERFSYTSEGFFGIADDAFFIGPKYARYLLVDTGFRIIKRFPISDVNPNGCEYFVLQKVGKENDQIVLEGIECDSVDDFIVDASDSANSPYAFRRHLFI